MKREIVIRGMSCKHCSTRVEEALNSIAGVKAKVDLKKGIAEVTADQSVSDTALMEAITQLGYEPVSISVKAEKKGLFGR